MTIGYQKYTTGLHGPPNSALVSSVGTAPGGNVSQLVYKYEQGSNNHGESQNPQIETGADVGVKARIDDIESKVSQYEQITSAVKSVDNLQQCEAQWVHYTQLKEKDPEVNPELELVKSAIVSKAVALIEKNLPSNIPQKYSSFTQTLREKIKPEVVWNIEKGQNLSSEDLTQAEISRMQVRNNIINFLEKYDFLITPTAPVSPNSVDERFVSQIDGIKLDCIKSNQKFLTLLDKTIELDKNDIAFFDNNNNVINLAGIVGGKSTACDQSTKSVLIECAYFCPEKIIGKTIKHNINSEAAYKFERNCDSDSHDYVLRRFLKIIEDHSNILNAEIFTYNNLTKQNKEIPFDFEKRSEKIYFTGSLGENFNYRFQVLNFLNNNFKIYTLDSLNIYRDNRDVKLFYKLSRYSCC